MSPPEPVDSANPLLSRCAAQACPRCGAPVACGMRIGQHPCWCTTFPPILAVPEDKNAACLCPTCLGALSGGGAT